MLAYPCSSWTKVSKGARIGEKISFKTKDGVEIQGLFVKPARSNIKTFVLLHGLASSQDEWQLFVHQLLKKGYGFLSYDARGHGKSLVIKGGQKFTYEDFGPPGDNSNWDKMVSDLKEAVEFLKNSKGIPYQKIGIIGASLGANVSLIYAASNDKISPVILLSPGLNYAGMEISQTILSFTSKENKYRPIAIVASPNDTYAFQSGCFLYKQIESNKKAVLIQGQNSNHGVQMLDKAMIRKLFLWISQH